MNLKELNILSQKKKKLYIYIYFKEILGREIRMTIKAGINNEELTMLMTVPNYLAVTNGENRRLLLSLFLINYFPMPTYSASELNYLQVSYLNLIWSRNIVTLNIDHAFECSHSIHWRQKPLRIVSNFIVLH